MNTDSLLEERLSSQKVKKGSQCNTAADVENPPYCNNFMYINIKSFKFHCTIEIVSNILFQTQMLCFSAACILSVKHRFSCTCTSEVIISTATKSF